MTNTPMTFEDYFKQIFPYGVRSAHTKDAMKAIWNACEAQQAQTIAELERMLGKVTFENECLSESKIARNEWLYKAKQQWGADTNVSFDVVWNEALALKAQIAELVEALEEVAPSLVIASDHYYDLHGSESPLAYKYNELHVKLHALIAKYKGWLCLPTNRLMNTFHMTQKQEFLFGKKI